ncbi:phospholipid-transporting P-type ATPase, putative [Entamoeba histolytica HM-1:IMSS-B]|uniref:Phospholipid-transporting ATPase n=6 Tax=Entamoeba histolytica TaxID=5759 RepID=C4M462_ENTH1|nr:phospholipid-transporting P-type ATPase, putative [Entamoeba histolytica HM-1:IMSS]EMD49429.1 phospholipid-transporting P-type ATPase, putative [Entamoeba histolytica KU27]EMH76719.1 phospholipid-transporting P-type ATPase, putative [Entamoeba histolytica HM-1:IMSS-B]EMS13847.1 phospholipid-transporting P-type ATPase, putative [Entamoeba histolytica HM-3:IMSS]ENY61451.1 phospholipid-transporting P-type ATPase, putative [Entamoeba histolytica HM-1:IMSS-A]GAT96141.1 phospholipid-transporting |eukprot:XP_656739.1 phospholipid-transporting P-type ATPase, putative [Entamoeba histolytica HM-1:IMSS]
MSAKVKQKKPEKSELRYPTIHLFDYQRNKKEGFPDNSVKTTKYYWWSFIPVFLFNQFKYFINLFFLIVAILSCIPQLSAASPVASIVPVCIMLGFSCIRELLDEFRKFRADKKLNKVEYDKLQSDGNLIKIKASQIYPGDILVLPNNSRIPADGIPLQTTNEDGLVFIETSELDGESNLKQRLVPSHFIDKSYEDICKLKGDFLTTQPDPNFDHFVGTFEIESQSYSVSEKNFIPNGCTIRNTERLLLFIVYCGFDTKLAKNSSKPKIKFSHTNRKFNRFVAIALTFDFIVILASTVCYFTYSYIYRKGEKWYLPDTDNVWKQTVLHFFSFLNMFSFLVPVSCLVSLEFSKMFQMLFMSFDSDLEINTLNTIGENETKGCMPWTGTLNDELGLVEYVLSDKTGTLTENEMKFIKCSIDGYMFEETGNGIIAYNMNNENINKFKAERTLFESDVGNNFVGVSIPESLMSSAIPTAAQSLFISRSMTYDGLREKGTTTLVEESEDKEVNITSFDSWKKPIKSDIKRRPLTKFNENNESFRRNSFFHDSYFGVNMPRNSLDSQPQIPIMLVNKDNEGIINETPNPISTVENENITQPQNLQINPHLITVKKKRSNEYPQYKPNKLTLTLFSRPMTGTTSEKISRKQSLSKKDDNSQILFCSTEDDNNSNNKNESILKKMDEFIRCMAICHEAVSNIHGKKITFQSGSPDEIALCEEASLNGYIFTKRTQKSIFLVIAGEEHQVDIQAVFPFDSNRKRMSVLVRMWDGTLVLYLKGADMTTLPLMKTGEKVKEAQMDVNKFAREGYRTLVLGYKIIPDSVFIEWMIKYDNAKSLIVGRDEAVNAAISEIEKDFTLLGVSAVEDKLQDGVPETIQSLRRGGIRIWMITGDKVETAINIGSTCGLTQQEKIIHMTTDNCVEVLKNGVLNEDYSVVFDFGVYNAVGKLDDFWNIVLGAKAVICCRVTPLIKGEIIKNAKNRTGKVCLGIGDGGNDISLIKESDVGVGIFGKEGTQAAQTSDYAVRKFRHLQKLIYFHGRQALRRNTLIVKLSFYKNVAFILMQFWFGIQNAFSGQSLYEDLIITLFNMIMTSMPPVFIGAFEIDIPFFSARDYPEAHKEILKGNNFTSITSYVSWLVLAVYQSVMLYLLSSSVIITNDVFDEHGKTGGYGCFSILISITSTLTILTTMALSIKSWNIFLVLGFFVSFILSLVCILLVSFVPQMSKRGLSTNAFSIIFSQPSTYLFILLYVILAITPLLLRNFCNRAIAPKQYQIIQEVVHKHPLTEYGKQRRIYQEGSVEAHEYFSEFCKPKSLDDTNNKINEIEMKQQPNNVSFTVNSCDK